jgi:hypothetical protein
LDDFTPALDNVFSFLSAAGGVTGTFGTTSLPDLVAGLAWSISYTSSTVQLSVVQASLPGDYNLDGTVDAADYVVWRKIDNTPEGYDAWRTHFGQSLGNGAGAMGAASAATPEPTCLPSLLLGMLLALIPRRAGDVIVSTAH